MKKLLLSLGTVAAVVAPIATVISCGSTDNTFRSDISGVSGYNQIVIKLKDDFTSKLNTLTDSTKEMKFHITSSKGVFDQTLDLAFVRREGTLPVDFTNKFEDFINKADFLSSPAGTRTIINELMYFFGF